MPANGDLQVDIELLNMPFARQYVEKVRERLANRSDMYEQFVLILGNSSVGALDTTAVVLKMCRLFSGEPELIMGLNDFMPGDYSIRHGSIEDPNAAESFTFLTPTDAIVVAAEDDVSSCLH